MNCELAVELDRSTHAASGISWEASLALTPLLPQAFLKPKVASTTSEDLLHAIAGRSLGQQQLAS